MSMRPSKHSEQYWLLQHSITTSKSKAMPTQEWVDQVLGESSWSGDAVVDTGRMRNQTQIESQLLAALGLENSHQNGHQNGGRRPADSDVQHRLIKARIACMDEVGNPQVSEWLADK